MISTGENIIRAKKKIRKAFNGKIYLLVDGEVFSSSETFAYFSKATKFATIIGERTGGDGIGTDPLITTLPNSGISIRYTGEMGLNIDGSANEEMRTKPDFEIKGLQKIISPKDKFLKITTTVNK